MLDMFRSFSDELQKIAASVKGIVDGHHAAEKKDWDAFAENMKNPRFRKAMIEHPKSDEKLRRHVQEMGDYLKSKKVVAKVPSRTDPSKTYEVKELPSGRLGCSCNDWKFNHSVNGSDCVHIKSMSKTASITPFAKGMNAMGNFYKSRDNLQNSRQYIRRPTNVFSSIRNAFQ